MSQRSFVLFVGLTCFFVDACSREPAPAPTPASSSSASTPEDAAWLLAGSTDDRFVRVSKQLRGFDVAMVETGYRYSELHWAGQDRNWDYAKYQVDKIRTAVKNGIERRPKRGPSAQMLEGGLQGIEEAIRATDGVMFAQRFEALTGICNGCHQAERVPFMVVRPPTVRTSPISAAQPALDGGKP